MHVRLNIKEPIGGKPRWWQKLPNRWPFLVWLVVTLVAFWLYFHGGRLGGITGTIVAQRQIVAPIEDGVVKAVHVEVGDPVRKGQLLVEMDTSVLDAEMAFERLQAERQFAQALARADQALQEARIRQAEIEGEKLVLEEEVSRLEALVAKQLVDARVVAGLKARLEALRRAEELYPGLIAGLEKEYADALARKRALAVAVGTELDTPVEVEGENEAVSRLNLLIQRRNRYRFFAEFDGVVSRIFHSPGDTVVAGDPVLTLVGLHVTGAEGFLPEASTADVRPGMLAYVTTTAHLGPSVRARVVSVTPDVMALPARANPLPQRTLRGRRVFLKFEEPCPFLPGESVSIQFERPFLTRLAQQLWRSLQSTR